tara:strand:- start:919 stop:1416 length:498 start_codon:yes stop_codon:yes gene_type:complete
VIDKVLHIKDTNTEDLLNGESSYGSNLDLVIEVYSSLFDKACGSCPSKFIGYINKIKNYEMENECLYRLRGSAQVIVTKLGNKTMTNHNITNELAEAFLSTNTVNRIAAFQTYPKDWEERVAAYGVKDVITEPSEPVLEPLEEVVVPKVSKPKRTPKKRAINKKK